MPTRNLVDWIALNLLPRLGPITVRRALERFGDPGAIAYRVPGDGLRGLPRIGPKCVAEILEARRGLARRAEKELRRCEKQGVRLLVQQDPDYPAALATLPDAPIVLYVKGRLEQGVTRVAIVGSRLATRYGQRVAAGTAGGLALRNIEVVSGGARGIDAAAHRGALEASGRTIAVMGSGFGRLYPPEHAELYERITGSGAVVTEFPLDQGPKPELFPRRNRLVSGLSAAIVVVEAARRSGSLVTAGHALEQGREVLAVPGPVTSSRSEGCHHLIQQGAKLVHRLEDILEELSPMYRGAVGQALEPPEPDRFSGLLPDEEAVLDLLDEIEPVQLDELADRAPFGVARLQAALFGLEVRGAVETLAGRNYRSLPGRPSD